MKPRIETSQISTKIASRSKPHDFIDFWLTSGQASEILVYLHEQNLIRMNEIPKWIKKQWYLK